MPHRQVAHLASVSFCYATAVDQNASDPQIGINHAWVIEFDEPPAAGTTLPPYTTPIIVDAPLSIGKNEGDCRTVSPTLPVAIPPTAYLVFRVSVPYSQTQANTVGGYVRLGRVTTTYTP